MCCSWLGTARARNPIFLPHHLNPDMRREFRKFHAHVTCCNMFDSQFLMMTKKKKKKKEEKKDKKDKKKKEKEEKKEEEEGEEEEGKEEE